MVSWTMGLWLLPTWIVVVKAPGRVLGISHQRGVRERGSPQLVGQSQLYAHLHTPGCRKFCISGHTEPRCLALWGKGHSLRVYVTAHMPVRSMLTPMFVDARSLCCMQSACKASVHVSVGQRAVYASALPVQRWLRILLTREKVPFKVPHSCAQMTLFHLLILLGVLGSGPDRTRVISWTLGQYGLKPVAGLSGLLVLFMGRGAGNHFLEGKTARCQPISILFLKIRP